MKEDQKKTKQNKTKEENNNNNFELFNERKNTGHCHRLLLATADHVAGWDSTSNQTLQRECGTGEDSSALQSLADWTTVQCILSIKECGNKVRSVSWSGKDGSDSDEQTNTHTHTYTLCTVTVYRMCKKLILYDIAKKILECFDGWILILIKSFSANAFGLVGNISFRQKYPWCVMCECTCVCVCVFFICICTRQVKGTRSKMICLWKLSQILYYICNALSHRNTSMK